MLADVFTPRHRHGRPRRPGPARCRPQVEVLEARCLLTFQVLATLGDPVPGVGFRINDFEPNGLNNRGDVLFGDDLGTTSDPSTFFGEGIFLRQQGSETLLAHSTGTAPGGGTYDFGFMGPSTLNEQGDAAFAFFLQPAGSPTGVNGGTYRYSHSSGTITPVVEPGVTPAPGGGTFAGSFFAPTLDNAGNLVFAGIVPTDKGVHIPGEPYVGLGLGVYRADTAGHIARVVVPGDAAPGGGTFDIAGEYASGPWVNNKGDVVFDAHVAGEEAAVPGFPPQASFISTLGSLYFKDGATGRIKSIAHSGDAAPGGGTFRQATFPQINDAGDILFTGDLTPAPAANQVFGLYRYSKGQVIPIARPGDSMPGGGHFVTASVVGGQTHLNNAGDIVFNGVLDTDVLGLGTKDTGLFEWSHGHVSLIARTGTVLPGVGTLQNLVMGEIVIPPPPILVPNSGAVGNDRGQILFGATLTDGRQVLLLYTPGGSGGAASGHAAGAMIPAGQPVSPLATPFAPRATEPMSAAGQPGGGSTDPLNPSGHTQSVPGGASLGGAIDTLFAGLGTGPFGDPLAGGVL